MSTYIKRFLLRIFMIFTVLFGAADYLMSSDSLLLSRKNRFIAVIDAGHGGHDVGAMGDFAWEKDINLNIALELGRLVKRKASDIDIIFTRSSDRYLTLEDRALIANKNNADVFISIHTNSTPNSKVARGTETYFVGPATCPSSAEVEQIENSSAQKYEADYLERYKMNSINTATLARNMDKSELLARMVQEEYIVKANRVNRGVREARFYVLLHTQMPSILTEVGFVTTLDEESYLTSDKGVRESAQCIYDALLKYKSLISDESMCNKALLNMRHSKNSAPTENVPLNIDESVGMFDSSIKVDERSVIASLKEKSDTVVTNDVIAENRNKSVVKSQTKEPIKSSGDSKIKSSAKDKNNISFYVQVFAVSAPINDGDERIKGLENVEFRKSGSMYKCICCQSSDYKAIKKKLIKVKEKYPDAYIIAYEGEREIKVSEALEYKNN